MCLHPIIAGKLAAARGDSHYLRRTANSQKTLGAIKNLSNVLTQGQASVKQRVFCIPGGQKHNPGGNKTQADHVGPVNVICKVLITTWRLCEAVCAGSQLSRQRRPDLLPPNNTARATATALETGFSLR